MFREKFKYLNDGAADAQINNLLSWCGSSLPKSYLELLRETNGAEYSFGAPDADTVVIWNTTEVQELPGIYELSSCVQELIIIGSDGEDQAIVLDTKGIQECECWPICRVSFDDIDQKLFVELAPSFDEWVNTGFTLKYT